MTPERWKKVEEVFESALERTTEERPAYLAEACSGDESLRGQVEALLRSHEQAGSFIEAPAVPHLLPTIEDDPAATVIGRRIGAYKIVREIGRGGMGAVYLAVRADDEFQKRVAIKLIKRGMDTDFVIRRFRHERQILASLDHPNVARLLDGGTTEDGLPYFVMEFVEGRPIDKYCDTQRLSITERLRLFLKVCSAVQYAHQNLIIHRDLKPSNILVTADGTPKLLDFGIAKLLNPEIASPTLDPTTATLRLMTPEYASPEQVRGEPATTISDVYSLGVLLYELLTGHRPYRLLSRLPEEIAHVICKEEPEKPSVIVGRVENIGFNIEVTPQAIVKARQATLEKLHRQLAGDLDSIVLKALRKEPQNRYSSVEQFSDDISRHLEGLPVSAQHSLATTLKLAIETSDAPVQSRTIAILPFRMLHVQEKGDEYLGPGMADALITKLSNIRRIVVRPTSSVLKYAHGEYDPLAAGYELDVGYVLDGRVQRVGDRVRVTVQLINMRDGAPSWAASFDEKFTDILSLEDSISAQVAQALIPRLSGEEQEILSKRETENPKAYQAYLKGRYYWSGYTEEGLAKAILSFMEAIEEDPDYAHAHAGVADYYNWLGVWGMLPPRESFAAAKDAAARALELDPTLAEAHTSLAFAMWAHDWDWVGAEREFKRAIELNPSYAVAHHWYSYLHGAMGRHAEAITEIQWAQKLDPLSPILGAIAGFTFYNARQYDRGLEELQKALELEHDNVITLQSFGWVYGGKGMYTEAISASRKAAAVSQRSPLALWTLGYVLAAGGQHQEAREVIGELEEASKKLYVSPYYIALIYAGLGEWDEMFAWLEKAYENRDWWLLWLRVEPRFDQVRSDPRFQDLLRRIGFNEAQEVVSVAADSKEYRRATASGLGWTSSVEPASGGKVAAAGGNGRASKEAARELALPAGETGVRGQAPPAPQMPGEIKPLQRLAIIGLAVIISVGAFLLYRFLGQNRAAPPFQNTRIAKLTTTGNATSAAISPDGKYVVYSKDEGGRQTLFVRQVAIAGDIRIVPPAEVKYGGITFSHDGTYVYYVAYEKNFGAQGGLYQVPSLGGSVKKVIGDISGTAALSPDGKRLAFVRRNLSRGEDALIVAGEDGSGEKTVALRKYPDKIAWTTGPAWSPDGKAVATAFESTDPKGFYINIIEVRIDDGSVKTISAQRWQYVEQVAWLSDGGGLLIIGQEPGSSFQQIWQLSYPGGEARRITNDLSDYIDISLTGDSGTLVTVQSQTLSNVYIAPKGDPNNLTKTTPGAGRYFDLSFMPDGKIIYASDATGIADIWQMEADGTGEKQLTANAGRNYAPTVSPDGRYIVFHSSRTGNWTIWRMDIDGSNPRQLTTDNWDSNWPYVSPDSQWVYFHHIGSNGLLNLWRVPIDGGTPVQLTDRMASRPSVSPRDGLIACWYSEEEAVPRWTIAVLPPEGGKPIKTFEIPPTVYIDTELRWTPDGRAITYLDHRGGQANLWMQPLDDGPPKQLTDFKTDLIFSFDWSRDGRLVYSRGLRTSDVVLIKDAR